MRLLLQRVRRAAVFVEGRTVGEIETGLLVLAGFGLEDGEGLPGSPLWEKMLDKVVHLRIFPDDGGRMNRSLADAGGDLCVVSQFTLYADCRRGRRPSFTASCPPEPAERLYDRLLDDLEERAPGRFASGKFGAEMDLDFVNWGPVTILLDSALL
ncbi:MAG: D-aminoacyl-tRNA deacylase [Desulfovibrionaceae bacterium]